MTTVESQSKRRVAIVGGSIVGLITGNLFHRIGWDVPRPRGTMFAWAPIPEPYRDLGSVEFASMLVREAQVAVSPGVGFGPGGEGYIRFALIENEARTRQALRGIKDMFKKDGLI